MADTNTLLYCVSCIYLKRDPIYLLLYAGTLTNIPTSIKAHSHRLTDRLFPGRSLNWHRVYYWSYIVAEDIENPLGFLAKASTSVKANIDYKPDYTLIYPWGC